MSYCTKCGAYVPDWAEDCPACGAPVKEPPRSSGAAAAAQQSAPEPEKDGGEYSYSYVEPDKAAEERESTGSSYAERMEDDAELNKGLGVLCYFGPMFMLSLALRPKSPFVRYHANQGLLLMLLCAIAGVCFYISLVGWMAGLVGVGLGVVGFIRGISNAAAGKCEPLPVIGGISLIK